MKYEESSNYDWADCILFLMIANAEVTDYNLSNAEVEVIIAKADKFIGFIAGEGVTYTTDDVRKKVDKVYNWYMRIQENIPEEQLDGKILSEVQRVAKVLKDEDWFNDSFAQNVIYDLVDVAKADGEVIENFKGSLNSLADFWGVDKPF